MKVKECMSLDVCCCCPNETISEVAKKMCEKHIGCIPVCNENKNVVGLITDRDIILRSIACDKDVKQTPISEIMTTSVCCCNTDTDVTEAIKLMSNLQVRRLPVIENDKVVGILTIADLANDKKISAKEVSDTVEHICGCGCNAKNAE